MAETKQNLPFRPLEVRGHGVWDPERKTFYLFKHASSTVAAKSGVMYFVHSVVVSVENHGDKDAAYSYVTITSNRSTFPILSVYCAKTVDASNVHSCNANSNSNMNILCDVNTPITCANNCSAATYGVLYAEIPDDVSGQ